MLKKIIKVYREHYVVPYIILMFQENILPIISSIFKLHFTLIHSIHEDWLKIKVIMDVKQIDRYIIYYNDEIVDFKINHNKNFIFIKVPNEDGILKVGKYKKFIKSKEAISLNENSIYLFIDRVIKADDNAEFLYRTMLNDYKQFKNIYFSISKSSEDYRRLKELGFKLVEYDTKEFDELYLRADAIISSNNTWDVENYKGYRYTRKKTNAQFIFLQHGVIGNNLIDYFSRFRLNKIVLSTEHELNHIKNNFLFFDDELVLSGLPRNDYRISSVSTNKIMYVPTWDFKSKFSNDSEFKKSFFYNNIVSVLKSEDLYKILSDNDFSINFILHPEVNDYKHFFEGFRNDRINIFKATDINYGNELCESSILITDYSSIFYDFVWMKKPVIFYQTFEHYYGQATRYSDLGEVCSDKDELLSVIAKVMSPEYKKIVSSEHMCFNNGNSCKYLIENLFLSSKRR